MGTPFGSTLVHDKNVPLRPNAKERPGWNDRRIVAAGDGNARLYTIAVTETARSVEWGNNIDKHIYTLFFDAERGTLGEGRRLNATDTSGKDTWAVSMRN